MDPTNSREALSVFLEYCRSSSFKIFFKASSRAKSDATYFLTKPEILTLLCDKFKIKVDALIKMERIGPHSIIHLDQQKIDDLESFKKTLENQENWNFHDNPKGYFQNFNPDGQNKNLFRVAFDFPFTSAADPKILKEKVENLGKLFGNLQTVSPIPYNPSRFNLFYQGFPRSLLGIHSLNIDDIGNLKVKILWPEHFCTSCNTVGHSRSKCPAQVSALTEDEKQKLVLFNQLNYKLLRKLKNKGKRWQQSNSSTANNAQNAPNVQHPQNATSTNANPNDQNVNQNVPPK